MCAPHSWRYVCNTLPGHQFYLSQVSGELRFILQVASPNLIHPCQSVLHYIHCSLCHLSDVNMMIFPFGPHPFQNDIFSPVSPALVWGTQGRHVLLPSSDMLCVWYKPGVPVVHQIPCQSMFPVPLVLMVYSHLCLWI